jgi:hypothetical protein
MFWAALPVTPFIAVGNCQFVPVKLFKASLKSFMRDILHILHMNLSGIVLQFCIHNIHFFSIYKLSSKSSAVISFLFRSISLVRIIPVYITGSLCFGKRRSIRQIQMKQFLRPGAKGDCCCKNVYTLILHQLPIICTPSSLPLFLSAILLSAFPRHENTPVIGLDIGQTEIS